jgi:K+-sensing histidine kinase KdpD
MSKRLRSEIAQYGCAILSVALAIGARRLLDPVLGEKFPFTIVFFAVLVTAWYGGLRPALAALVLGALGEDFFLLSPRGSLRLTSLEEQLGLGSHCWPALCTPLGSAQNPMPRLFSITPS